MPSKWRRTEIQLQNDAEAEVVPVVWSAVVAVKGRGDGRMIPVLILDTTKRPDIDAMVKVHSHLGSGDAISAWSFPSRWAGQTIRLVITTMRPTRCTMVIAFDLLSEWAGVVDQIMMTQAVYIQPGRPGDRLVTTVEHAKILVEIPTREIREEWDRIYRRAPVAKFKRIGMHRAQARQAADEIVKRWRGGALSYRLRSD